MAPPTPQSLRDLVDRYCAAVTAGDMDAIIAMYVADAVQRDPSSAPPNVGHAAIRTFYENARAAADSLRFEAPAVHTSGNHVAFDFTVTVSLGGGEMVIHGIEVFTVSDDHLITEVTAYWDDADVAAG
jgi:steroid delta-isomerase